MNIIQIAIYLDIFTKNQVDIHFIMTRTFKNWIYLFFPKILSYSIYIKNMSLESFPNKTLWSWTTSVVNFCNLSHSSSVNQNQISSLSFSLVLMQISNLQLQIQKNQPRRCWRVAHVTMRSQRLILPGKLKLDTPCIQGLI